MLPSTPLETNTGVLKYPYTNVTATKVFVSMGFFDALPIFPSNVNWIKLNTLLVCKTDWHIGLYIELMMNAWSRVFYTSKVSRKLEESKWYMIFSNTRRVFIELLKREEKCFSEITNGITVEDFKYTNGSKGVDTRVFSKASQYE